MSAIGNNSASQSKIAIFLGLWLDTPPPFTSKEEVHEELQTEANHHLYSRALIQGYLEDPDNFFFCIPRGCEPNKQQTRLFWSGDAREGRGGGATGLVFGVFQTQR